MDVSLGSASFGRVGLNTHCKPHCLVSVAGKHFLLCRAVRKAQLMHSQAGGMGLLVVMTGGEGSCTPLRL